MFSFLELLKLVLGNIQGERNAVNLLEVTTDVNMLKPAFLY